MSSNGTCVTMFMFGCHPNINIERPIPLRNTHKYNLTNSEKYMFSSMEYAYTCIGLYSSDCGASTV